LNTKEIYLSLINRAKKYSQAKHCGYELVSYLSSRVSFLTDHPVGDNCFILEDNRGVYLTQRATLFDRNSNNEL
jgi:hypothetical protein